MTDELLAPPSAGADHLARMLQYAGRRVREMPVGREWVLAVRAIAEAMAELLKLALLGVRLCMFVLRALGRLTRRGSAATD